jgi:membrane fusion protein, heavy metal efflux system
MKRSSLTIAAAISLAAIALSSCSNGKADENAGAPPPLKLERAPEANVFPVDNPSQFPLVTATAHIAASELRVTASVTPDISRSVPVISIATGRVVEIAARLGDTVTKGQLLLRVQSSDIAGAFSDYQKAVADETLSHTQLERAQLLYEKGAISLNDLQVAQDADAKAQVDVKTAAEHLRVLGNSDLQSPSAIVDIRAPIAGVITDQQVTNAAGVAGLGSPNPFTISDLTYVWIICDVFENDLSNVHLGENADVHLNAYPNDTFTGVISNVGSVLDPNIRSAKVRIEVRNPGFMRPGMFATATFHGKRKETYAAVPATAILHLHDRDWVYLPIPGNKFRRVEVTAGDMLPGSQQEILAGLTPGQQVVSNALEFQNTAEQ